MATQGRFNDPKQPCTAKGPDPTDEETFKDKLDRVATEARAHKQEAKNEPHPVVETGKTLP
jgi:hypothetical protein